MDSIHPNGFCKKHLGMIKENLILPHPSNSDFKRIYGPKIQNYLAEKLLVFVFRFFGPLLELFQSNFAIEVAFLTAKYKSQINLREILEKLDNNVKISDKLGNTKALEYHPELSKFLEDFVIHHIEIISEKCKISSLCLSKDKNLRSASEKFESPNFYFKNLRDAMLKEINETGSLSEKNSQILEEEEQLEIEEEIQNEDELKIKEEEGKMKDKISQIVYKRKKKKLKNKSIQIEEEKPENIEIQGDQNIEEEKPEKTFNLVNLTMNSFFKVFREYFHQHLTPKIFENPGGQGILKILEGLDQSIQSITLQIENVFEYLLKEVESFVQLVYLFSELFVQPLSQNEILDSFKVRLLCTLQMMPLDFGLTPNLNRSLAYQEFYSKSNLLDLCIFLDLRKECESLPNLDKLLIHFSTDEEFCSEFNFAYIRQFFYLIAYQDKKLKPRTVYVDRIGTLSISNAKVYSELIHVHKFWNQPASSKILKDAYVELKRALKYPDNNNSESEKLSPLEYQYSQFGDYDNFSWDMKTLVIPPHQVKLKLPHHFYNKLRFFINEKLAKNYVLWFIKPDHLKFLAKILMRVDTVLPDQGFWEPEVTIDVRQDLLVESMKMQQELRELIFGACRAHLVHHSNMKISLSEFLEILLNKMGEYVREVYTSVEAQRLRFKEADHDHPMMLYRAFNIALFNCMVFEANSWAELEKTGRVMLSIEDVWKQVQRLSVFSLNSDLELKNITFADCELDELRIFKSFDNFQSMTPEKRKFLGNLFILIF